MTNKRLSNKDTPATGPAPARGFWRSVGHFLLLCMAQGSNKSSTSDEDPSSRLSRIFVSGPESMNEHFDLIQMHDED